MHTVRGRGEIGPRLQPRSKYEAIVDHMGAHSDREEKKSGWYCKVGRFSVCRPRVFGMRKAALGSGAYGAEMERRMRRHGKSEMCRTGRKRPDSSSATAYRGRLHLGDMVIDRAMGAEMDHRFIWLFAADGANCIVPQCEGDKLEINGQGPRALSVVAASARNQVRLFFITKKD